MIVVTLHPAMLILNLRDGEQRAWLYLTRTRDSVDPSQCRNTTRPQSLVLLWSLFRIYGAWPKWLVEPKAADERSLINRSVWKNKPRKRFKIKLYKSKKYCGSQILKRQSWVVGSHQLQNSTAVRESRQILDTSPPTPHTVRSTLQ